MSPKPEKTKETETKKEWLSEAMGELAVDFYETDEEFIVRSTIAGVKAEDLDVSIENGTLTIKGERQKCEEEKAKNYFYQECYWGSFLRQIILPEEVDGSKIEAAVKDGVLTVKIPKAQKKKRNKITIKQVD